jgi:hypothetical protein
MEDLAPQTKWPGAALRGHDAGALTPSGRFDEPFLPEEGCRGRSRSRVSGHRPFPGAPADVTVSRLNGVFASSEILAAIEIRGRRAPWTRAEFGNMLSISGHWQAAEVEPATLTKQIGARV